MKPRCGSRAETDDRRWKRRECRNGAPIHAHTLAHHMCTHTHTHTLTFTHTTPPNAALQGEELISNPQCWTSESPPDLAPGPHEEFGAAPGLHVEGKAAGAVQEMRWLLTLMGRLRPWASKDYLKKTSTRVKREQRTNTQKAIFKNHKIKLTSA